MGAPRQVPSILPNPLQLDGPGGPDQPNGRDRDRDVVGFARSSALETLSPQAQGPGGERRAQWMFQRRGTSLRVGESLLPGEQPVIHFDWSRANLYRSLDHDRVAARIPEAEAAIQRLNVGVVGTDLKLEGVKTP